MSFRPQGGIFLYDRYCEDRAAIAQGIQAIEGRTLVPPFDHPDIIAGLGTAALELRQEMAELDILLAPVGEVD